MAGRDGPKGAKRKKFLPCVCGWSCSPKAPFCSNCGKKDPVPKGGGSTSPPNKAPQQQPTRQPQRGGAAQAAHQDSAKRIKELEAENKRLRKKADAEIDATPSDNAPLPGAAVVEQQVARHQAMVEAIGKIPAAERTIAQQVLYDESLAEASRLRASLAEQLPFDVQHSRVSLRVRRKKDSHEKALKHHAELSEKLAGLLVELDAATERVENAQRAVEEAELARKDLLSRTPLSDLPDHAVGEELQEAFLHIVKLAREQGLEEQLGGKALDNLAAAAAKLAGPKPPRDDDDADPASTGAAGMAVDERDDDEHLGATAPDEAQREQNSEAAGYGAPGTAVAENSWTDTARKRGLEVADKLESITRRLRLTQKAPQSS